MATNRNEKAYDPRADHTSTGQQEYTVYGEGGKARHEGYFSNNNPYFANLTAANNNQDKDALYELAIQWEADYANRQMQLEENRAILEEQREYDSPLAQVQRMRAAGINPDLEGAGISSGSGSGSAQLTNPGMADQTGQTKFSNQYDNLQTAFAGINAASSFAGALTSGVSGIMNAVSNMKVLPSQIALNEANAGLSSAKAGEINALLEGKKKSLNLSNVAQGIQNSTATLQQLAEFSNLIAPDTADFAPILKSLGVDEANIAPYSDIIKQMHANPQMRDKYAKAETSARWSEAENAQYTEETVAEMTELAYQIQYEEQHWKYNTASLQRKISGLLNTESYAEQIASNESMAAELQGNALGIQGDAQKLYAKQLSYDTEVFLNALQERANVLTRIDHMITAIRNDKRGESPQGIAAINRLNAEKIALRTLLSSQFNEIKTSFLNASQKLYETNTFLNDNGNIRDEGEIAKYTFFSDATFNDLIHHRRSAGEIANQWVNTTISAAGVAVDAAGVARGYNFNQVYKQAHDGSQFRRGVAAGKGNASAW